MTGSDASRRSVPTGVATGVGSLPGDDPREAVRWVVDALPDLPHLPELPARGPWASITGRGAALLLDLPLELEVGRWRTAQAPGRDLRRARSLLEQDLDAVEEVLPDWSGFLKLQACGPVTLASAVEMRGGDILAIDDAALRDVAASLAEGLAQHVHDVSRRVPGAELVVQLDEPALPAVTAGVIPRPSGWGVHRAVDAGTAGDAIATVLRAVEGADAATVVHCCADVPDWTALTRATPGGLSVDLEALDVERHAVALADWVDAGGALWVGVSVGEGGSGYDRVHHLGSVLGAGPAELLPVLTVTPRCGLPEVEPDVARAAYASARDIVRRLEDEQ